MFGDMWDEYLGTANTELTDYLAGLRPRYRTALLSNSFVGAREREEARYGFDELTENQRTIRSISARRRSVNHQAAPAL